MRATIGLLALLVSAPVTAHDLDASVTIAGEARIVRALYGGTDPASYLAVLIYSPGDARVEFQNGRTDARGVFAFVPDVPGRWRVVLDDGEGHRKELEVQVASGAGSESASPGSQPMWQKLITGLSLIFGVTGVWYWRKARRLAE